jgi:RNA polymerase sigma factor for flagellar operon FliA
LHLLNAVRPGADVWLVTTDSARRSADLETERRLVTEHIPLVGYIVSELIGRVPSHVSKDDLSSAGLAALAQAARGFDATRGVPFGRFATTRIRGAIIDELRGMDWASRSVRSRARKVDSAREQLVAALGRTPTPEELATALGVAVDELEAVAGDVQRAVVLSLQGFADPSVVEDMVAGRMPDPEEALLLREQIGYLHGAVSQLPERLRAVVVGYFFEERPMADLARELKVSESRVSQMRAEALVLLRDGMNSSLEPERVSASSKPDGVTTRRREAYFAAVAAHGDLRTRLAARSYDLDPGVFRAEEGTARSA